MSEVNLAGWVDIGEDLDRPGLRTMVRMTARGDVGKVMYSHKDEAYMAQMNQGLFAPCETLESAVALIDGSVKRNGGWLDYSQVIGWDCKPQEENAE